MAQPLTAIFAVQVTSRRWKRIGPSKTLLGSTAGVLTAGLLMLVTMDTNLWWIRGIMGIRGIAVAFNMVDLQTTAFSIVSRAKDRPCLIAVQYAAAEHRRPIGDAEP